MDGTDRQFANRCLPMLMANSSGWMVVSGVETRATWDGSDAKSGLRIRYRSPNGAPGSAQSHFGGGIITWTLPWLFRTPPGWDLLVRGPSNQPVKGAFPCEGLVETDWTSSTFTMNWLLTHPDEEVVFPAGQPICMILPQQRFALEKFAPQLRVMPSGSDEEASYLAWAASRAEFIRNLGATDATRGDWQRDYFLGSEPAARQAGHRRNRRLRPFHGIAQRG